jgi:plastocyanin
MKPFALVLAVSFLGGAAVAALAAERSISQKGRVFSETAVTLKKGEVVTFVNDDNIAHNIFSTSPVQEFNLGSQAPGTSTPVTFGKAGEVTVLCAIHPRMKMVVTVTD